MSVFAKMVNEFCCDVCQSTSRQDAAAEMPRGWIIVTRAGGGDGIFHACSDECAGKLVESLECKSVVVECDISSWVRRVGCAK